jgi:DNA modification methylase
MDKALKIYNNDCLDCLKQNNDISVDLTFLDPPFNQGKEYRYFDDSLTDENYWIFMKEVLYKIYEKTVLGGSIYTENLEKIWHMDVKPKLMNNKALQEALFG